MIPRPYQKRLVSRAVAALEKHGDTLAVAATGAGKTIAMAFLAQEMGGRVLVLQHRQELVQQNMSKYRLVNPRSRVGLYTADTKSWRGDATFAMVQTLAHHTHTIPHVDLVIPDEAHHCAAATWRRIIDKTREINPNVKIAGFTATPERGDRRSLRGVFSNVCDQVTIRELVQLGFLVPPRAFAVDVAGSQERLRALGKQSSFFDQDEVANILNTVAVNAEVVRHWKDKAGGRQTIVFCATVQHAEDMAEAYRAEGVPAECIHGDLGDSRRRSLLARFSRGEIKVLTNCMVLTEGFDSPPVSCVVLLRKCSEKGPLVQMVGRGLRTVNPEEHPGLIKKDCIVLDFGTSLLTHGDLDMNAILGEERDRSDDTVEVQIKVCPDGPHDSYRVPDSQGAVGCGAEVPIQTRTCPLCGFKFETWGESSEVTSVELTELDILESSPFQYVDLFGGGWAMMASGFDAWAGLFSPDGEDYYALGLAKANGGKVHLLTISDRLRALAAADDWMRTYETSSAAKKSKGWLSQPATEKQIGLLNRFGYGIQTDLLGGSPYTKYSAACHANFQMRRRDIETLLGVG